MPRQHEWSVDQDVREDAERVFVPADQLPEAGVGDVVRFTSQHASRRSGRVTELLTDQERGSFFTVELDRSAP
jgi:hypothetical protein